MKQAKGIKIFGAVFLLIIFLCKSAYAGGILLYEFGSPDVGLAAAGWAARAQDASTVFTNPAGMSRLDKSQFLGGIQGTYGYVEFSPNSNTTFSGDDGGNSVNFQPRGSLFVVQKINEHWSAGFGALSYFGLAENYGDSWVGRYFVKEGTLIGITLTPAVSYRVNNWLSLGVGLNAMYAYIDDKVAIKNPLPSGADGELRYKDGEWGYGWTAGILVEPKPGTRFGLTYLSKVDLSFSDTTQINNLGPELTQLLTKNVEVNITVPQIVMFSAYHELNPKWAVMGNVGWQNWSKFGDAFIENVGYNDTWHVSLGVQYRYSPAWTFSGGASYDSSAVDDDKRSVILPLGESWRFGLGCQYAINPNLILGASYEFLWRGNMSVNQTRSGNTLSGDFKNTNFSFLALNLIWKF